MRVLGVSRVFVGSSFSVGFDQSFISREGGQTLKFSLLTKIVIECEDGEEISFLCPGRNHRQRMLWNLA